MNTRISSIAVDPELGSLAEVWPLLAGIGGTAVLMALAVLAAASSVEIGMQHVTAATFRAIGLIAGGPL